MRHHISPYNHKSCIFKSISQKIFNKKIKYTTAVKEKHKGENIQSRQ